jgi:hypothetical protein
MDLDAAFNDFYAAIELRPLSEQRIGSAWQRLHSFLTGAYGVPDSHVFIQGSYANDTAIRPCDKDGEYDVDIVVVGIAPGISAADAISDLRLKLEGDGDLTKRLEADKNGRPCVRLRYADDPEGFGFHIDVVPARPLTPYPPQQILWPARQAPMEVPMRGREQWRDTAPLEYTKWCQDAGEALRRTVRELKRWRDVHDAQIKSIVLQVLIGAHHPGPGFSDAATLEHTLAAIQSSLGGQTSAPQIFNPSLPSEDLADRWPDRDFVQFLGQLDEAVALTQRARASQDEQESHQLWQKLLGGDFPDAPARRHGLVVPPAPTQRQPKPKPDKGRQYG